LQIVMAVVFSSDTVVSPVTNLGDPDAINCYRSVTGRAKQARPQDATSSSAFQSAL
jgi:hypothetical protein